MPEACQNLVTRVSPAEAFGILEPYFLELRGRFVERGFDRVKRARLTVLPEMHDTARHFAGTTTDGREIALAPEMVELDEHFVVGILAHELGHSADFLYPGEFVLGQNETIVRRDLDRIDDRQRQRWQRAWETRDPYVVEKTADLIASGVWGSPIGYAGPCKLETFEGGAPRPKELR